MASRAGGYPGRTRDGQRVLAIANELERLVFARRLEEAPPGGQLEEDDPDGEDVASPVDGLAAGLLGRHVRDLALEAPALGVLARPRVALGDPEVDDLHVAAERDDDVLRRDVPMNDVQRRSVEVALLVRVREAGADAEHDRERVLHRELDGAAGLHPPDDGAQVLAVNVLHRDEVGAVDHAEVEDLHDVRMRERGRDARLVEEHLDERLVLVHRRQDPLDDDELLEPADAALDREEELGHAARREPAHERVPSELAGKAREGRVTRRRRHLLLALPSIEAPMRRAPSPQSAGYASGHELAGQCTLALSQWTS